MKIKRVLKYATGSPVPDGAVYLCTKTETLLVDQVAGEVHGKFRRNVWVWHYFLVEQEQDEEN